MATDKAQYRMKRDIKDVMKTPLPGIFGVPHEDNIMIFHAIVIGPAGTPYEKGFFYFVLNFPDDFPKHPPTVKFMTTGGNTIRFNPNLYSDGKVCLSILGTFNGPSWTPTMSLSSVLLSVQSLLCEFPYHNEPGFEKEMEEGHAMKYNMMILHDTIREAVLGMVNRNPSSNLPKTLKKRVDEEFLKNYEFYEQVICTNIHLSGTPIIDTLYKYDKGCYMYGDLLNDLDTTRSDVISRTGLPSV